MNLSLAPMTEKFIQAEIAAGRFATAEQLIEEAVSRLIVGETLDDETLSAIDEGQTEIDRGEGMDFDTFKGELYKRIGRV